jgi:hypothetical protein
MAAAQFTQLAAPRFEAALVEIDGGDVIPGASKIRIRNPVPLNIRGRRMRIGLDTDTPMVTRVFLRCC